jgi:alkylhydroperoxidase family enzyme
VRNRGTADKFAQLVSDLRESVFDGPGRVDPEVRRSAATGQSLAEPWLSYTKQVRDEPATVTSSDIESLKAAGHSEDEIFEITVAAAVGASLRPLDAGLKALRGKD